MTAPAIALPAGYVLPPAARILKAGQDTLSARAGDRTLLLTATMFAGDHWAAGRGWTGPMPLEVGEQSALVFSQIERTFVSRNLMRDVVERHRNGIAGREALWTLVPRRALNPDQKPSGQEAAAITEFTAALTNWWEDSGTWLNVQSAIDTALWSGTGHLRLYVDAASLEVIGQDEAGRPLRGLKAGTSLADALRRIHVQTPQFTQSTVTRTHEGRVTGALHTWIDEAGRTHHEVHERIESGTRVHPDLLPGGTDGVPSADYPVEDLLIWEIKLPTLVTDSVRRLSWWLNKNLTMGSRNIDLGGFTETTILNAQMPEGKWVEDPYNPGKRIWQKASPHLKGAGVTNYVNGFPLMRQDPESGKMVPAGVTTPSIDHRDPTPFNVFRDSIAAAREMIYDEARQLHVLITGDAAANGVSRQQAVNDFLSSLEPTRIALEQMLRWLLGTVLALGLHLAGRSGEADAYRVRVQARTSAVQPTAAEVETALKLHETGSISEENFLQRIGVEDVEAERLARQREGITPAIALRIASAAPAPFIAMRALMLGFPALGITEGDIAAQRAIDLMTAQDEPGGTEPPAGDPGASDLNTAG